MKRKLTFNLLDYEEGATSAPCFCVSSESPKITVQESLQKRLEQAMV